MSSRGGGADVSLSVKISTGLFRDARGVTFGAIAAGVLSNQHCGVQRAVVMTAA